MLAKTEIEHDPSIPDFLLFSVTQWPKESNIVNTDAEFAFVPSKYKSNVFVMSFWELVQLSLLLADLGLASESTICCPASLEFSVDWELFGSAELPRKLDAQTANMLNGIPNASEKTFIFIS